jgi:hypothetical protein
MDYRNRIISKIADKECERVSTQCILALQKMTEGMQSGDGSPLRNVWEEVCVQVQYQYSFHWEAYLITVKQVMLSEIQPLDESVKQAIWLQTDDGMRWEDEEADPDRIAPYCEDDIVNHILHKFVLATANDWSNRRIEKYMEQYSTHD